MTPTPRNNTQRELFRIQAANGGLLRPVDVVREAEDPASPLHSRFDWNNTEAGHQWRLHQARQLIRCEVQYLAADDRPREFRVFVSLVDDRTQPDGGYRAMVDVMTGPGWRAQLLLEALTEMRRFQIKYHELTELAGVFAAMQQAQAQQPRQPPPPPPPPIGGDPAQI